MSAGPASFGAMRHRFLLQTPVEAGDGAGGVTRGWADVATLWGSLEPRGAGPAIEGEAPVTSATHAVTLRWRPGVTAAQRLVLGSRIFAIRSVGDPEERRHRLLLLVQETGV